MKIENPFALYGWNNPAFPMWEPMTAIAGVLQTGSKPPPPTASLFWQRLDGLVLRTSHVALHQFEVFKRTESGDREDIARYDFDMGSVLEFHSRVNAAYDALRNRVDAEHPVPRPPIVPNQTWAYRYVVNQARSWIFFSSPPWALHSDDGPGHDRYAPGIFAHGTCP